MARVIEAAETETKIRDPRVWGSMIYSTERDATVACLSDWIGGVTGCYSVPGGTWETTREDLAESLRGDLAAVAHELVTDADARRWIALDEDEDGQPIGDVLRCTEAEAKEIFAELRVEGLAELTPDCACGRVASADGLRCTERTWSRAGGWAWCAASAAAEATPSGS